MVRIAESSNFGNCTGDWKLVVPRRGKRRPFNSKSKVNAPEVPGVSSNSETDPFEVSKLLKKMESSIKKLESSDFFCTFTNQLQQPEIFSRFSRILASELQFLMVIYGIGSIEHYEPPRLQLSLAILLKRKFDWIGDIEVFDPVISLTESKVLESFGCRVLTIDEQGKREASKAILFFMPHCDAFLYDNLIEANWKPELLNRLVIFGNSFEGYHQYVSVCKRNQVAESVRYVLESRKFVEELVVETVSEEFFRAFHETSWHFFDIDPSLELQKL